MWGLTAGLVAGLGLIFMATAMEVSSRPAFCGSCHIMKPYYESWKSSSHKNFACVECHIPPGVTAELRKKYEALSMVARYFTGTYGTNPWTEIDDASCLRCHERRLLSGRELFGDVLFDHAAHLSAMRRGKTLRCTSCHSQIVQGSHIAVTVSTCILCHFKGQQAGTGTARCTLCHQIPDKVIRRGTLTFNHADVQRYGMECTWCHARPEGSGDGPVPRERCVTCHNEASRLEKYGEPDLLHRMHVTEHKVDCMDCHLEIEHVGEVRIEVAATGCGTCHSAGHTPQLSLYSGVGGRGVPPMPSPMFAAGVRCEGCHLEIPGHESEVRRAGEISCMSCHGPAYRRIFLNWLEGVRSRTGALQKQMARTGRDLGATVMPAVLGRPPAPAGDGRSPAQTLADARLNLDLVVRGHGIHNVDYAYALLEQAHDDMNSARRARGLEPLPEPWTEAPYASPCLGCHQGIEGRKGTIFGRTYGHEPHVRRARLDCVACHRPHEERGKGEVVRFGEAGCESCHHRDAKADCLACHLGVRKQKVASFRGEFDHAFHLDEAGQACDDCHDLSPGKPASLKKEACAVCH
jgi:nitrate/TMAO reductase-like tetraheme cytochrome c subunit